MIDGLAPLAAADARVLVLGSFPSVRSLVERRYYAHPRNAFWPIMDELFGLGEAPDYERRAAALVAAGVAVWDVLQTADRPGSADAAIVSGSEIVNDFEGFFAAHCRIHHVFFNGAKAEQLYRRLVLTRPAPPGDGLALRRLPSTSPANAALSKAEKLAAWRVVREAVEPTGARRGSGVAARSLSK
jgi:hypoxanthine-DNA glycosylase